jgi:hypothetical protein
MDAIIAAYEAKGQKLQMIDSTSVRVHQQAAAQNLLCWSFEGRTDVKKSASQSAGSRNAISSNAVSTSSSSSGTSQHDTTGTLQLTSSLQGLMLFGSGSGFMSPQPSWPALAPIVAVIAMSTITI